MTLGDARPAKPAQYAKQQRSRRGTPSWLPWGGVGYAGRVNIANARHGFNHRAPIAAESRKHALRRWAQNPTRTLMMLAGLAYPTPPQGSHKGVPLRWCVVWQSPLASLFEGARKSVAEPSPRPVLNCAIERSAMVPTLGMWQRSRIRRRISDEIFRTSPRPEGRSQDHRGV